MHIGNGAWVVVDSSADHKRDVVIPLKYLESIGLNPASAVVLVVATHWHEDHVRGMTQVLEACPKATFCCAGAFTKKEFLATTETFEGGIYPSKRSGLRELHNIFLSIRDHSGRKLKYAVPNRVVYERHNCKVWTLSPSDNVIDKFIKSMGDMVYGRGRTKRSSPNDPNDIAVVLLVETEKFSLLLGADLERRGWATILEDISDRTAKASVFKVPHHGSEGADHPGVWAQLLESNPVAVLAPWRNGGRTLPSNQDIERISSYTKKAYITSASKPPSAKVSNRYGKVVERMFRRSEIRIRTVAPNESSVRLRRRLGSQSSWKVETFGNACNLKDII